MSMIIPNGMEPAFPFACQGETTAPEIYYGMTLRDYFAAKALLGLLSQQAHPQSSGFELGMADGLSASAYSIADSMLAERSKPK